MALVLHNTLTKTRERFEPRDPRRVTMYVCGPTVYNYAHIGNARPPVVFDVLARLLRLRYGLVYARNVTDVDDRINEAARVEGVPIGEITKRYLDSFHDDLAILGVAPPDVEPRVTETIPEIIRLIEKLIAGGHAYAAEGHVLFDVPKYAAYGALSRRDPEDMLAGARVDVAPYKRSPGDFVLWKPSPPEIVGWPSPWGRGRPGWHIECSAMSERHLGETIDIHGGGVDLVFPHHENEVAQSTCAHGGERYARFWLHNGLVNINGEKMSKSLGNVKLVRDVLATHGGETVRLALLTAHYRQPLDWTDQLETESRQKLDRMYRALEKAKVTGPLTQVPSTAPPKAVLAALEDDLNTPEALAALFGIVRDVNRSTDPEEANALGESLRAGGWLLGLLTQDPIAWSKGGRFITALPQEHSETPQPSHFGAALASSDHDSAVSRRPWVQPDISPNVAVMAQARQDSEIDTLVSRRDDFRRERNFAEADRIRRELAEQGILIDDIDGKGRWRREHKL